MSEEQEEQERTEVQEAKEQADEVIGLLDEVDWVERDGFYRAIVHFGERDRATLCALNGDAAQPILELIPAVVNNIPDEEDGDAIGDGLSDALQNVLNSEFSDQVWQAIDQVIEQSLVSWQVEEYCEMRGVDSISPPNADMPADVRLDTLKELPLPMLVRMIGGVFWLSKNL